MPDPRFAQRLFTLLSVEGGITAAKQAYDTHRAHGGAQEPLLEALFDAAPGSATFVKLQRALMAELRTRLR